MRTYVINLAESHRRRELMVQQLDRLGVDYEVVPAVNGHRLAEAEIAALCEMSSIRSYPDWLTPGAIGAALSHRQALSRLVEEGQRCGLILEDDVVLPSNLATILDQLESAYVEDELILLYWLSDQVQSFQQATSVTIGEHHELAVSDQPTSLLSAVAYVAGRDVARRLIDINTPVRVTSDLWSCYLHCQAMNRIRCLVPSPLRLANLPSDIKYGPQHLPRRFKRWLEMHLPPLQRLSARRRDEYFVKRQKYIWV